MDKIVIRGAKEHNLKEINLEIPRDQLVVITGVSGSGKSSLAFDTLYAEGQRRYVESLSAYARQFLEQMDKPDVQSIEGLSPAISIEQKTTSRNPRSTVATVTEIYDYLRLLYARLGVPHCPECRRKIFSQSPSQIIQQLLEFSEGTKLRILAPMVRGRKGEYRKELEKWQRAGFVRVSIDGEVQEISEEIHLEKTKKHDISLVIDRLILRKGIEKRLADSVETALRMSEGVLQVQIVDGEELFFSEQFACVYCGVSLPELSPRLFSFNSPYGACSNCDGLGVLHTGDPNEKEPSEPLPLLICDTCHGSRLRKEALSVLFRDRSIMDLCQLSIAGALELFKNLSLTPREEEIGKRIFKEITDRLLFLKNVGLDYLTLDRSATTLSGGEGQRIRLATQIGSSLTGVLYILDEPSIGLHHRDNRRLIDTLKRLRNMGNTVLVVEHDEETIRNADHLIEMGPGAGFHGGEVVAQGTLEEFCKNPRSLTGQYLSGKRSIPIPARRRSGNGKKLRISGARGNNLKNLNVSIPLGIFTCVTGVSGSGKSTLVVDTLYRALAQKLYRCPIEPLPFDRIEGIEQVDKVIDIDQSPIGRTPRSNPVTYTGAFTPIRELFAQLPEARARGYGAGRFSFNVKGGRCETCQGGGQLKIEMHFLPDVHVTCDACQGLRYNRETLDILYKGKNIAEVLKMTVEEASPFFERVPMVRQKLQTLNEVGLGYIELGQAATTLSGGEAQRIKLAKDLSKRSTGSTLYILDEPTTGLHFADIEKLLDVLNRIVDTGNTVVVIEHQLDVIQSADYLIDLGPEGGEAGGELVACGAPEEVTRIPHSYTGQALKETQQ
ncbi:MAG: excinuclease ABC subunit UvrA [Deltaproteobacteria bacterium]|nr:excinuclease ABC subunit UvrA [Deltaproteobacteria bacterium]